MPQSLRLASVNRTLTRITVPSFMLLAGLTPVYLYSNIKPAMRKICTLGFYFYSLFENKIFLPALACSVLFVSCKKNDRPSGPTVLFEKVRVKTITGADAATGWEASYAYDAEKRIIKESETFKISDYSYSGNKLAIKITENNTTRYQYYELNPQGYISADTASDGTIYTYEYNNKGFITKVSNNQIPHYERNYYYNTTTGLLDSTRSTIGSTWNNSQIYAYDMNRENSLEERNTGMPYFGRVFPRPFLRYEYKYDDNGLIKKQVTDYLYTYDEKGRIKSKSYENAGQRLTYHYTYY